MLASGAIDVRRARTIEHATSHLTIATARGVVERVQEAAPELTTGQLQARIKKLCIQADVEEARKRYEQAVERRRVIPEPTLDGTASLIALDLPPHRVAAITRRINGIARSLRIDGETRTMDQLRADVYLDLLQGTGYHTKGAGLVHMTADLDTLTGLTEHPGDLNGFTPVISGIARQVATDQPDSHHSPELHSNSQGMRSIPGRAKPRGSLTEVSPSRGLLRSDNVTPVRFPAVSHRVPSVPSLERPKPHSIRDVSRSPEAEAPLEPRPHVGAEASSMCTCAEPKLRPGRRSTRRLLSSDLVKAGLPREVVPSAEAVGRCKPGFPGPLTATGFPIRSP
jgi:hypothetical protein